MESLGLKDAARLSQIRLGLRWALMGSGGGSNGGAFHIGTAMRHILPMCIVVNRCAYPHIFANISVYSRIIRIIPHLPHPHGNPKFWRYMKTKNCEITKFSSKRSICPSFHHWARVDPNPISTCPLQHLVSGSACGAAVLPSWDFASLLAVQQFQPSGPHQCTLSKLI